MKRISGLVLMVSLLLPLSFAHATDVTQLYTNNLFAFATSTDPATMTETDVFLSREKGKGAYVDTIVVMTSGPSGSSFLQGTLPKGALQISATRASLDVDVSEIAVIQSVDFPSDGVISVDWKATKVSRTSGSTKFQFGNVTANIVGTSTFTDAVVSGSVAGTELVNASGDLNVAHESVIIRVSTP